MNDFFLVTFLVILITWAVQVLAFALSYRKIRVLTRWNPGAAGALPSKRP